jgi:uncharacterized protein
MRVAFGIIAFACSVLLHAQGFDCSLEAPKRMPAGLPKELAREKQDVQDLLVWQYVDWLSPQEWVRLDRKLTSFARETSNRILVLVVDTLCGYPESDLAFEVGQKWGIGKAGFDNGIVILVQPMGPPGQRAVFIATGYGLEGAIPDLAAKRVVDNELLPRFREGNFYSGLDKGTDVLMALAKGEFDAKSYGQPKVPWGMLVFILLVIVVMVLSWRSSVKRYAATNKVDFWTAMWLLSQMQRDQRSRGGWGGGGGGSFGGGGFGGFGGGGFGGGGAGGRW